jgi:methyl-accepting chemotaxis protein
MMKFIINLPIFRRLFIAFTLATILPGIVIVLLGSYYLNALDTRGQTVRTSFDAQSAASEQQINLQRMNALLQTRHTQIFASLSRSVQDPSLNASGALINIDIVTREADFQQALTAYQNNFEIATSDNMSTIRDILQRDDPSGSIIRDQQAALSAVIHTQWPAYKRLQDQEIAQLQRLQSDIENHTVLTPLMLNQAYEQAYQTLFDANAVFTDLHNSWQSVVDIAVSMGETVTAVGPSETQPILTFTIAAFFFTVLVILGTGYMVNLTITHPLRHLASLTRRIIKGDTTARARLRGRDEIYLVAQSMNSMLDNIVRLIQDAQTQRDALQAQVEKLVNEVSGVGEGDLRIQAEVTTDALGVLADSFNYMVEELSSLIVRVKLVAQEVENSTTMTFERMAQLVESADQQIYQMTQAAEEVEHMAASSRQVAQRSQVLHTIARGARQTAQSGRDAVQQTVEGIRHIQENVQGTAEKVQLLGDSSREINNIVDVIAAIAHQTNRLALDAAIQAAMAGDNGRGFGAVAADIRRLAERTKDQASMIARIVRGVREDIAALAVSMLDTQRETSAGTALAQEAGTSLESIFTVVERQAQEIETIYQMTTKQLESSSAVAQIMQEVSNSTQQSSAVTHEVSRNMERLARLAEQLLASVGAFKLQENQNFYIPTSMPGSKSTPEEEQWNDMTVSGIFRAVNTAAQPQIAGMQNGALSPATPNPSYSGAPYQQHNGSGVPLRPGRQTQQQ